MGESHETLLKAVRHYQEGLDKYTENRNDAKLLHYIDRLYKLPIKVIHLEQTGVGRTVNGLRKLGGEVGDHAKSLVAKWKEMVVGEAEAEEEEEDDDDDEEDEDGYQSGEEQEHSNESEEEEREPERKRSEESSSSSHRSSDRNESNDKEKYKRDNKQSSSSRSEDSKHKHHSDSEKSRHSSSKSKYEHGKSSSSNGNHKHKSEHKSHKRKTESSDDSEVEKQQKKLKKDEYQNNHKNKRRIESDSDNESYKKKHRETPDSDEAVKNKHKHKHKDSKDRSKEKEKVSSSSSSKKIEESTSSSSKSDGKKHEHSSSKKSKDHDKERKDKDKKSSSSNSKTKEHHKDSSNSKSKECRKDEHKKPKSHKNVERSISGIDSGSGASFAEALGMCEPSSSKNGSKRKSTNVNEKKEKSVNKSDEVVPKLLKDVNLDPIDINLSNLLPTITPNYRPLGNLVPDLQPKRNTLSENEALCNVMTSKNQRTKVYSGNKTGWGKVPSLFEMCIRILQDNIDALEYTGGVPYSVLKPILDKATPNQLFVLEHHNPYLIEDTDDLWALHCQKDFRNKPREELESWREMYMRCLDEREAKLKALTANIKQAQDKSLPVRTTKLAYVDDVAKPPRNIARKQAKNGTGLDHKRPSITPSSRLTALATSGEAGKVSVPNPGARAAERSSNQIIKPKKAPLMAKSLSLLKNRFRR